MITIAAPLKRSEFKQVDFGEISYTFPSPGITSAAIDEIIIGNVAETDDNQVDFIKRYGTWFVYTFMNSFSTMPYSLTYIYYDRDNRVAYTASDSLRVVRKQ